jgi:hypothetical protein
MRHVHVIPIEGPNLVGITVEPVPSAVRVTLDYRDDHVTAFLLTPTETARLAVALQAAAWHHIGGKSGDETP